jgi:hypothetical protein
MASIGRVVTHLEYRSCYYFRIACRVLRVTLRLQATRPRQTADAGESAVACTLRVTVFHHASSARNRRGSIALATEQHPYRCPKVLHPTLFAIPAPRPASLCRMYLLKFYADLGFEVRNFKIHAISYELHLASNFFTRHFFIPCHCRARATSI